MALLDYPAWLGKFDDCCGAEEVVEAWLSSLEPAERQAADCDPPVARTALRQAIVNARERSKAVAADASAGWKYTGAIIRALDRSLGVEPLKPSGLFGPKGVDLHAPREILKCDTASGKLGITWSSLQGASRVDLLLANGVTHRLNVAAECERTLPASDQFVTATVAMRDLQHEQMTDAQEAAAVWVEQLKECMVLLRGWQAVGAESGSAVNVNINCQMGKNRSGAVVAAWLCIEHGWGLLSAVDHLRQVSSLSLGNPHLNVALAHVVGADDVDVPLNPADEGGSWVTFSPPGSPKPIRSPLEGDTGCIGHEVAEKASHRLRMLADEGEREEPAAEEEQGLADLADLLEEL